MFPFPGMRRRLFVWHHLRLLAVAARTYPDFWFACAWQNKPLKRMAAFRAFQRQNWHHTPPVVALYRRLIDRATGVGTRFIASGWGNRWEHGPTPWDAINRVPTPPFHIRHVFIGWLAYN